jgi:ABC-type branched-subunit amino acid transport system substrate-binding protein
MGAEMRQAIDLAVEETNAAGGILGAAISAAVNDDASDIEQGQHVARKFCAERNLLGVVGHYNSDVSIAAAAIYRKCELPMITPIASNPELTDRELPNVFRFTNRDDRELQRSRRAGAPARGPSLILCLQRGGSVTTWQSVRHPTRPHNPTAACA